MKVGKKGIIFIFLTTYWNLSSKYGNLETFLFENLANLGHFFPWKILCIGQNHIFRIKI